MKTKLLTIFLLLLLSHSGMSQGFQGKGDAIFNFGPSFGRGQYDYYRGHNQFNLLPPLSLSLEIGVHNWFTIGPYFGWEHRKFEGVLNLDGIDHSEWEWTETWIVGGLRFNWYLSAFLNEKASANLPEQLDFYLGVLGGVEHYGKNMFDEWDRREYHQRITRPAGAMVLGIRYMFSNSLGIFLEGYGGYYFRDATFGVSLKF